MADLRGDASRDSVDEAPRPDHSQSHSAVTWTWSVYDGTPESVSDGVDPVPAPAPRISRGRLWAVVGVAAAVAILAGAVVVTRADPRADSRSQPRPAAVFAPDSWQRVDVSLTAGLVIVSGGWRRTASS